MKNLFSPTVPEIIPVENRSDLTAREKFEAFDKANPAVYTAIVQVARAMKSAGFKKAGIKMIFERLRWLHALKTKGSNYKINNNFAPFYARKLMRDFPDMDGFFEVRVVRGGNFDA